MVFNIPETYKIARARVKRCDLAEPLLLRLAVEEYFEAVDGLDLLEIVENENWLNQYRA